MDPVWRSRRGLWVAVCALAILPAACRCQRPESSEAASASSPAASQSAPVASVQVPSLVPGPPSGATPLSDDALWKQALARDTIDLARLANREGAAGLLVGLEAGGDIGLTALAALPHADDGELALSRLCEILDYVPPDQAEPVLSTVQAIVAAPPRPAERFDLEGYRGCAPVLDRRAADARLSPAARDLASSARQMLREQGVAGP